MKYSAFIVFLLLCSAGRLVAQDYYETGYKIKDEFTQVYGYSGTAASKSEKVYGLINKEKKLVIPVKYKYLYYSGEKDIFRLTELNENEGLFAANSGKFILEPLAGSVELFSEGLAVVKRKKESYSYEWGAVDVTGQFVIPMGYEYLGTCKNGLLNFKKEGKMGYINKQNQVVIEPQYNNYANFSEGLAAVKTGSDGKFGYIDVSNKLVIPAKYEDATAFSGGYATVALKKTQTVGGAGKGTRTIPGEYMLINKQGAELNEKPYHYIYSKQDGGIFSVVLNDKKGVIDSTGKIILPTEYDEISIDSRGIRYKTPDKKYGLVNARGKELLKAVYDYISNESYGLTYTLDKGYYTVLNKELKTLIPADIAAGIVMGKSKIALYKKDGMKIFDSNGKLLKTLADVRLKPYGHKFSGDEKSITANGEAMIKLINLVNNTSKVLDCREAGDFNEQGIFVTKDINYDFYDYTGKKLNPAGYYSAVNFSEGICALQKDASSKPVLADKKFNTIKELDVTFQGPFSEGLAVSTENKNYRSYVTYLDKTGKPVFSLEASAGGNCKNGLIMIKNAANRLYFIDRAGRQIAEKTWENAGAFEEGLAAVKDAGKWGFIDTTGKLVIPVQFDETSSFSKGTAIVQANGKYFQINKKGEAINSDKYEGAATPGNGTFPVQKNGKVGLIDQAGKTIIGFQYENIKFQNEDRIWALKDKKWGLLDNKGKALTGFIYENVGNVENGYAKVMQDGNLGLVNKTGKLVVPALYKSIGSVYQNTVVTVSEAKEFEFKISN